MSDNFNEEKREFNPPPIPNSDEQNQYFQSPVPQEQKSTFTQSLSSSNEQSTYVQQPQYVQEQQAVQNSYLPNVQNIYSQTNSLNQNEQPVTQEVMQPNSFSQPTYQPYTEQSINDTLSAVPEVQAKNVKPKKQHKAAKRIALIVSCLALAICVGLGGGYFGTMLANNQNAAVETNGNTPTGNKSANEKDTNKDGTSKGSLNITQNQGTQVAATTTQEVAEKASESVVEITTETVVNDSFMQQYVSKGAGSGVIISEDGYIITNHHVIEDANTVNVTLKNGKTYKAKLIGKDKVTDIALIKIEETGLTPAVFGDSDNLKVGETVVAIGNPLGELGGTVTNGIISALNRDITIDGQTMNLLQTNAAINPGNSGGGLFNANAELVAVVNAKSGGENIEGLGFAIPINDVVDILDDLMDHGYVTGRPQMGISVKDISTRDELFSYRVDRLGAYVVDVQSGSAGEKAGLEIGDCITKIDDTDITSSTDITSTILKHKVGDTIKITVYRDGETMKLNLTLEEENPKENNSSSNFSDDYYGS